MSAIQAVGVSPKRPGRVVLMMMPIFGLDAMRSSFCQLQAGT
jgi:hypothetical protein